MFSDNFRLIPLKDITKRVKVGFVGSCNDDYCSFKEGIPMIRTTNLSKEGINLDNLKYISKEFHENHVKSQINFGDILIARHGHNGLASLWDYKFPAHCLNVVIVETDEDLADKHYLTYMINSSLIQNQIKCLVGGSVQGVVNTKDIADLLIPVPSLEKQKRIANFLLNFDKKIEVNKKINHHLESLIISIFKDRFFNFNGFKENLIESSLGLIPENWCVDYLGSKKSSSILGAGIDDFNYSKIYIATADVNNSTIINHDTFISFDGKPSRANMQPIPKSIWFAKMIDSKKLIMVDDYSTNLLDNYIFSTGFCGLKCSSEYFYYLWSFILTDEFDRIKNNFCTGTTMMAINNKDVKKIEFPLPNKESLYNFNLIAHSVFEKIYYNEMEIKKLTKIRDTLLPKLMNEEIDVSKIEI